MSIRRITLSCWVATTLASAGAFRRLPERVATHWDLTGAVDGTMSRAAAALFGPLAVLVIGIALALLFRLDPRRAASNAFASEPSDSAGGRASDRVAAFSIVLVAIVHVFIMAHGVGVLGDIRRALAIAFTGFLLLGGNTMGKVRPNWFVGIRTPWTLSSDHVWRDTHRVAARAMVLAGVLAAPAVIVARGGIALAIAVSLLVATTLGPAAYSYVLWRRAHRVT